MDVFVKILIGFLLLFLPFAFAGTEPWAFTVLQSVLLLAWVCVLFLRQNLYRTPLLKPVFYTLGVLVVLALVQACFPQTQLDPVSPFHPITLVRIYTLDHASLFVTYLATAALVMQVCPSQREIRHLLEWSVICSLLVALVTVSLPKGDYIFRLVGVSGGVGPFLNRNHASLFFALNALLALGLFFAKGIETARRVVSVRQKRAFWLQQICLAVVFFALAVGTVMTRSRGGMLSLLVGVFVYIFLYIYAIPKPFKKRLKSIFITLAALLLTIGWVVTHTKDINVFAQRATNASEETRKMLYRSSLQILEKYPVWGIGIGAMPVVITSYVEWNISAYIERLHSDWLEILLGVGYLGAVFVLVGVFWFIWRALATLKRLEFRKQLLFCSLLSVLCAMGVGSLVDFHFFIPANAFLFFVVLGLVCAPSYALHHVHHIHLGPVKRGLVLVILVISLYLPTQKMLAWRLVVFGKGLKHEAKIAAHTQALAHYSSPRYALRLAISLWNASLYAATPEEQQRLREAALAVTTEYLQKYPRDKELSRLYVRIVKSMGK